MPPPKPLAELRVKVLPLTVAVPKLKMPPPKLAVLLVKVLRLTVAVPPKLLKRPPPKLAALLVKVLPLTVAVPPLSFSRPPPLPPPALLEKTLLLTVTVPKLSRPPPLPPPALPPAIVRPEIRTVSPASTVKMRKEEEAVGSRSTVELLAPRPLMVIFRLRSGRALSRVIVPCILMGMMYLLLAAPASAAMIADRRVPLPRLSSSDVTGRVITLGTERSSSCSRGRHRRVGRWRALRRGRAWTWDDRSRAEIHRPTAQGTKHGELLNPGCVLSC